ncbi:MAG TPA: transposase [Phycisphaerae bacterium]|nr:transposase [Phycisphaerae bacterium]
MPRPLRLTEPGVVYHVLNRRAMRMALFRKGEEYAAFERVLAAALERADAPGLLAYCLMPNHWHLVLQAGRRTNLSSWMQWLTVTHTHRWHARRGTAGEGPLYQGRFKSFPVQEDPHFLTVCRYVEANPLRAGLVRRAEDWMWNSLFCRQDRRAALHHLLAEWPVDRPRGWAGDVNGGLDEEDLEAVRRSVIRGAPFGSPAWQGRIAARLELPSTLRPRGRPRKAPEKSS